MNLTDTNIWAEEREGESNVAIHCLAKLDYFASYKSDEQGDRAACVDSRSCL